MMTQFQFRRNCISWNRSFLQTRIYLYMSSDNSKSHFSNATYNSYIQSKKVGQCHATCRTSRFRPKGTTEDDFEGECFAPQYPPTRESKRSLRSFRPRWFSRSQPSQNRYTVQYPPTRELKKQLRSQFLSKRLVRTSKGLPWNLKAWLVEPSPLALE